MSWVVNDVRTANLIFSDILLLTLAVFVTIELKRMTRNFMSIKEEFCTNGWMAELYCNNVRLDISHYFVISGFETFLVEKIKV